VDFLCAEKRVEFEGRPRDRGEARVIESPCTKVCVMDAENRYCLGCKRTLGEIARWSEMADAERAAVLEALCGRRPAPEALVPFGE
jgi:predicted Fe-S protein YdhL (DUF1289 family)